MAAINQFRDEYYFLSNFFECPVTFEGITYRSSEAAFQARKCSNEEDKIKFAEYTPDQAKYHGKRVSPFDASSWNAKRIGIMYQIVTAKFSQHSDLRQRLIDTGDTELIEGNTWNDTFWGVSLKTGKGQNNLGKILMRVREEMANSLQTPEDV